MLWQIRHYHIITNSSIFMSCSCVFSHFHSFCLSFILSVVLFFSFNIFVFLSDMTRVWYKYNVNLVCAATSWFSEMTFIISIPFDWVISAAKVLCKHLLVLLDGTPNAVNSKQGWGTHKVHVRTCYVYQTVYQILSLIPAMNLFKA